jgi:diguanylate cyclase (GGDEF)-like protein
VRASRWTNGALLGTLAVYLCVVLTPGDPGRSAEDIWLGNIAFLMPVLILLLRGRTHRDERTWILPLASGIVAFVVGADLSTLQAATELNTETPSAIAYICVYPLFLTAILTALRRQVHGVGRIVALDGVTGALAGAAVAASAISPLIAKVWDGSSSSVASLVYPAGDVLLVAAALGALGVVGVRNGRHFALWAVSMVAFAVGDIIYAYLLVVGSYVSGSWLDGLWAVACSLMAVGATTLRPPQDRRVAGAGSLAVVSASAVAAVAVLVLAPVAQHGLLPSGLAVLTLACCGGRFLLAFHQVRELAAVRVLALTDELTGVANRRALYAELDRLFRRDPKDESGSAAPAGFALVLVDLDHFKEVNDSFGHSAGDDLLRAVVERFREALARLGTPHLLSRLGGDEFAILVYEASSRNAAVAFGAALSESLLPPVTLDGVVLHVRASIGVSVAPEHAQSRGDMLFAADAAMYAAKSSGDPVGLYSPTAVGDRRQRLTVAEDLYAAFERDELVVEYQPVVDANGGVVGVEALVRWDHPTRGRLSPAEFLDVAERYRLTPRIAERVLDVALSDLSRWLAAGKPLRASVNVSASDLRDERLVAILAAALLKHDIVPSALTIEVTESAMMHDPELARTVMEAIAELGVRLSVDDYGTGYSSLEYLLRLPIDEIKLDRAFSADLAQEGRSVAIVRSTIDLTHALGLHMVAEGVEDEQTLVILRDLGCDLVQGWHLGRPMSAEAFEAQLGLRPPSPVAVTSLGQQSLSDI